MTRRLVQLALQNDDKLLYHNEPIWRDGVLVGRTTSGMFGHTVGRSLGMGYVVNAGGRADAAFVDGRSIRGGGCRRAHAAEVSLKPFYDPTNRRVKDVANSFYRSPRPREAVGDARFDPQTPSTNSQITAIRPRDQKIDRRMA